MINHHAVDQSTVTLVSGACPEMYEGRLRSGRPFYLRYRNGLVTLKVESDDLANCSASIAHGDELAGIFESSENREIVFARLYRELVVTNWPGQIEPTCWCPDPAPGGYLALNDSCPRCAYGAGPDGLCPDRCVMPCCVLIINNYVVDDRTRIV